MIKKTSKHAMGQLFRAHKREARVLRMALKIIADTINKSLVVRRRPEPRP